MICGGSIVVLVQLFAHMVNKVFSTTQVLYEILTIVVNHLDLFIFTLWSCKFEVSGGGAQWCQLLSI
jgi:hypothetical protein